MLFDRRDDLQDAFARRLTRGRDAGPLRHYVPSSEGFADAVAAGPVRGSHRDAGDPPQAGTASASFPTTKPADREDAR